MMAKKSPNSIDMQIGNVQLRRRIVDLVEQIEENRS